MNIAKALADETRVRLLLALRDGELCVCQLVELAGLAPSTVSKHMSILKQAELVDSRKEGRWIYYRWSAAAPEAVQSALQWVCGCCCGEPQVAADRSRVQEITSMDPEELCRRQCARK